MVCLKQTIFWAYALSLTNSLENLIKRDTLGIIVQLIRIFILQCYIKQQIQQIMIDKEGLRQTALIESDAYGTKRRFGLFNQPISTAIGDDGPYKTKLHPRDSNGKPITQPRNFAAGPCRTGQMEKSYLGSLNTLAASTVKDQYIDPDRKLLQIENQRLSSGPKNQNKYKPASKTGSDILWKPSYEYKQDKPKEQDPKRNRQEDGRVKVRLRNALTNPGSTVVTAYFKHEKHLDDPYDRAHQMELERMKKQKAKEHEAKFRPNSFHASTFSDAKNIYGEDVELKNREAKETNFNIYKHEGDWKTSSPNKHGLYGYFSEFPKYMENPPRQVKRRASEEKKEIFKAMSNTLSTPSSSITTNNMNMRKYISHSFSNKKY